MKCLQDRFSALSSQAFKVGLLHEIIWLRCFHEPRCENFNPIFIGAHQHLKKFLVVLRQFFSYPPGLPINPFTLVEKSLLSSRLTVFSSISPFAFWIKIPTIYLYAWLLWSNSSIYAVKQSLKFVILLDCFPFTKITNLLLDWWFTLISINSIDYTV